MSNIIDQFKDTSINEITHFLETVDSKKLEEIANVISEARNKGARLHFTGIGKPSYVAKYMASLFSSTGTPAYFLDGTEAVHGSAGQTVPNDVVIAISNSGETAELLTTLKALKNIEVTLVGVSSNPNSQLANLCDYHLEAKVSQEGDDLNKPPRLSIIAETLLLQMLSLILQESVNLDKENYVKWHPGGSIGNSIKDKM